MATIEEILKLRTAARRKPSDEELRRLPDRLVEIHGRLSGFAQVRNSQESVREIASLVGLARADGYKTNLEPDAVEQWLGEIQAGRVRPGILQDGEVVINCLGLGVSASRPVGERPDLGPTMQLLQEGRLGAIYVTEGANRLSRDPDRVVSATLLKLMKDSNCKLRTPYEVLSPRVQRDWEVIHGELEEGAEELEAMRKRLHRRKMRKAARGHFVGEPIPPGFILPIVGQKANGRYEFGKIQVYPPHSEVVTRILEEYLRQNGSVLNTAKALREASFPAFEADYRYMERYTSLRGCPKRMEGNRVIGYAVSPDLVRRLARNLKLVGVWEWGEIVIPCNHEPAVSPDLFLAAYELATGRKRKGRAVGREPHECAGLLWCCDHQEPRFISSSGDKYRCTRDYMAGRGPVCLDIHHRFLDGPITAEVLRRLDFTPYADQVLAQLEAEAARGKLEEAQRQREEAALEEAIRRWKALLPCCVDPESGHVDREKEAFYWAQIRDGEARLQALMATPLQRRPSAVADVQKVRQFLTGLPGAWSGYPRSLRNRLLKVLIGRIEIRHGRRRVVEATVVWRAGLEQKITIHLPPAPTSRERRWTKEEDRLLLLLWPSSPREVLEAALPNRNWGGIRARAQSHRIARLRASAQGGSHSLWSLHEEAAARALYEGGASWDEMMEKVGRSRYAILSRAAERGWRRPAAARWRRYEATWEADELKVLQGASC